MRYDKHNKKLFDLQGQLSFLKAENEQVKSNAAELKEILDSTLHEVRRFSAQLSKFSERLSREATGSADVSQVAQSIFYTAGMISSRLAYTDLELNPKALESQTAIRSGIYKKFDKARRILAEEAREKNINLRLDGESRIEILTLPVFELLPFVLLDNAIKYSPRNQEVLVRFEMLQGRQIVTVHSIGPSLLPDEYSQIFEKGFRGVNARQAPGQGLGLFLAARVCQYHDISIRAECGRENLFQVGGVPYSEINFLMEFR